MIWKLPFLDGQFRVDGCWWWRLLSGSELGKWVLLSTVTWTSCLQLFKSLALLFFLFTLFSSLVYNIQFQESLNADTSFFLSKSLLGVRLLVWPGRGMDSMRLRKGNASVGVPLSLPLTCMTDEETEAWIRLVSGRVGNVELIFLLTPQSMFFFLSHLLLFLCHRFCFKICVI